jgi:hypothetical protein
LLKACAVLSNQLEYPRLNVWCVAPSRQYKTLTSIEVQRMFPSSYWIDVGSDFTIHGLYAAYGSDVDGKTLMVNDATVLFASKAARTQQRLFGALAELLSDECYTYADFRHRWTLHGKCTLIANQTTESYNRYKGRLLGVTLLERCFTAHHRLTLDQQRASRVDLMKHHHLDNLIEHILPKPIRNLTEYRDTINDLAMDYSALALRSLIGCKDLVTAMLTAHATLNGRRRIVADDLAFVRAMRRHLVDPSAPHEPRIIEGLRQHRSYRDICRLLHRKTSYKTYISKVAKKAKERGLIDDD